MTNPPSGTVTFLFTDIQGSTKLAREHPEAWDAMQARHHAILRDAIECHQGYIFQIIGDAFCAAFHTAGDALRAAIKAQTSLYSENWGDTPIKVRMGIHTGKAEIRENGEYHGYLAMSRVQRLMSAGHGGQVLVSAAAQELLIEDLPGDVSLRDLGERRLKDLIRPEHIYQLVIPGLPADFSALKTLDNYRHNLPIQLTSFIGREKETEEIKQTILTHRLVTLTGVGGTGKTRLALQVAADLLEQFPQGVWFVELASLTHLELIPQAILASIGISEQPGLTAQQQLNDYLQQKRLLLILDNCEHLLQTCAELVNALLSHSSTLTILATSREAFGISGEVIWHVPSLSLPDMKHMPFVDQLSQYEAVQLFIERTTLVQPHFQVTNANAPAIAQICIRLDGIPLAIELAAARVRTLGVEQIDRRLDDRFQLLTGGSRTALERHQTLRATIDWSYNLLSQDEKLLLCRLSVFAGGWALEAAEQVCAGKANLSSVLDLLTHLVEKSLVLMEESAISNRYRMLETTRQYAREKLLDLDELKEIRDRHLGYFLGFTEKVEKKIHGPDQGNWMDRLELDEDNLRAALDWSVSAGYPDVTLRLLSAWIRTDRQRFSEMYSWFNKIRALPGVREHPALYARLLNWMARKISLTGDDRYAESLLEESQALWLKLGLEGEQGLAEALNFWGEILPNSDASQSLLEQSLELYQKHRSDWGIGRVMFSLGIRAIYKGNYEEAETQLMQSLSKFKDLGDDAEISRVLNILGELARMQDHYERAGDYYRQAIKIERELHHHFGLSQCLWNLGWVTLHANDYQGTKALFKESFELMNEDGNPYGMIGFLLGFAGIFGMTGKPEQAAWLFGAFEKLSKGHSRPLDPPDQKEFDHYFAVVRKQLDEAVFEKAWSDGRKMTMEQAIAFVLEENSESSSFQGGSHSPYG